VVRVLGKAAQYGIAGLMTVLVIDALEMIEIGDHNG
jgi:hypothetical protein